MHSNLYLQNFTCNVRVKLCTSIAQPLTPSLTHPIAHPLTICQLFKEPKQRKKFYLESLQQARLTAWTFYVLENVYNIHRVLCEEENDKPRRSAKT